MKATKRRRLTAIEFVDLWQSSDTLDEFVAAFGWSKKLSRKIASHLRKRGVPLKKMSDGRCIAVEMRGVDFAALASRVVAGAK
jgi:hypothetical protein